mgnify:CR=1 FL=1
MRRPLCAFCLSALGVLALCSFLPQMGLLLPSAAIFVVFCLLVWWKGGAARGYAVCLLLGAVLGVGIMEMTGTRLAKIQDAYAGRDVTLTAEVESTGRAYTAGRVSAVFQEDRLCPQLTALQNVLLVLPGAGERYAPAVTADFARLGMDAAALALPAAKLSGGQKRRTALLRALWAEGNTLLLDEPFTGMDPATMKKAAALLKERCGEKVVLLATHDREAIEELGWQVIELG